MSPNRFPLRDPRTIARDIPGVLDVLFPRLSGGLVAYLNKSICMFEDIKPIPDEVIKRSSLQKSMLFELATAHAESTLKGNINPQWEDCLQIAIKRQQRHFDAKISTIITKDDIFIATWASNNLQAMLKNVQKQLPNYQIELGPHIPGMGWVAPGNGDFALGPILIEVKHTNRNFVAGDFRQVLMYWLLKYADSIETRKEIWSDVLLLNPRRNCALSINIDNLLCSASANSNRVELSELLRSIVGHDLDPR